MLIYLILFLIAVLSDLFILIPVPLSAITISFGALYNPFLVGLSIGLGSAFIELIFYHLALKGRVYFVKKKYEGKIKNIRNKITKNPFWIGLLGLIPFPVNLLGVSCGFFKISKRVTYPYIIGGTVTRFLVVAYFGSFIYQNILMILKLF